MIVREHLKFSLIYRFTRKKMNYVLVLCIIATALYQLDIKIPFNFATPISILGIALSFLLSFRNNSAYDRWWEARRIWGELVNNSRNFSVKVLSLFSLKFNPSLTVHELAALQKALIYRHLAFVYALKHHLRRHEPWNDLQKFLSPEELQNLRGEHNIPHAILRHQNLAIKKAYEQGFLEDFRHIQFDTLLATFHTQLGGCERIKNTVFPRQYSYYLKIALWIFLTLLPFSLIKELGYALLPVCMSVSFFFVILEYVGTHIENPFDNTVNDIPMSAIARTLEINLRQDLQEKELPEPEKDVDGYLY